MNSAAQDLGTFISEIHKDMKTRLIEAQEKQKQNGDKSRKQHLVIQARDKVWLLRRNLKTRRLNDILDYCRLGPFLVSKQINEIAYGLKLPSSMKIHLVFHVSLLEPYKKSTIPSRLQAPSPLIRIDDEEEFEVSKIIDSCINRKKLEYLLSSFKHSSNGILPIISSCLFCHFFCPTLLVVTLLPCDLHMDFT